jgi:hypothetical protein
MKIPTFGLPTSTDFRSFNDKYSEDRKRLFCLSNTLSRYGFESFLTKFLSDSISPAERLEKGAINLD